VYGIYIAADGASRAFELIQRGIHIPKQQQTVLHGWNMVNNNNKNIFPSGL
jgi:hypothetical protein